MVGLVEKYLLEKIEKEGTIHMTLVDPEKVTPSSASHIAKEAEACDTAAIMVGGSTSFSTSHLDKVTKAVKESVGIPVILFPNNITGISRHADAIWFMSLLNSSDPYFLMGVQVLGAPLIKKFGLEPIPLGYIIVGEGGAVSVVGKAVPIPYNKPELAAAHALAAEYFGMRFVYLEAGSGVGNPVPSAMARAVKNVSNLPLIVGGGIRTGEQVKEIAKAGADIIVTGNVLEENKGNHKLRELIDNMKVQKERR
ncbi:MAG TPA: geranylgeranylglyceryl/heptaprenylglyceryl phosphate synthase [Candidatus Bathyarchaeota archaeon]|nr:geranylgeranylglyceryl/heptaprenylglyceryl phosphate synthase [Candidatus Bathyarchaeota archaeon]